MLSPLANLEPVPTCHPDRVEVPAGARAEQRLCRRGGAVELLRLPELCFRALVRARRAAYDCGLARAIPAEVPVLSVGNLSVGGTGKTPFCIWLVRELEALGRKPGLLSRGYRALASGLNDEGRLVSAACPGLPQVQDADRVRGARELVARGVDLIVLDDGFQHRRLSRDQDWVLIDATRPWGLPRDADGRSVRALLPRGLLREPPAALARADVLVITRAEDVPVEWLAELEAELARRAPGVPVLLAAHRPVRLVDERGAEHALGELAGRECELASAIGNPQAFELSLRRLGARAVRHSIHPDHHAYTAEEAAELTQRARESGRTLLVTAKDAVKLAPLGARFLALEVELVLVRGAAVARARLESLPRAQHG